MQSKVALLFEFTLTYEQALAYRTLTGHTVRKSYWKDLTVQDTVNDAETVDLHI